MHKSIYTKIAFMARYTNQSGTRMNQNKMNGRRDCAVALFCSIFKEGAWPMLQCSNERYDKEYMNKKIRN